MKETVKTSRVAGYLEAMYRALNARYFGGELEEPIITIQSTPRAYAHVTVGKVWHRLDGREQREVNIGAGTLDRPIENVVASLLHELVHVQNMQLGIKDCSRGNVYHNKRFRDAAERCDLKISYDPRIGWSITEPTEALIDFIVSQGWEDIHMGRTDGYIRTGAAAAAQPGTGAGTDGQETQQHPEADLPLLRAVGESHEGRQHPVRSLYAPHGRGIKSEVHFSKTLTGILKSVLPKNSR